jgi:hypothetical protein
MHYLAGHRVPYWQLVLISGFFVMLHGPGICTRFRFGIGFGGFRLLRQSIDPYRRGCSQIRAWRHRGNMAGVENIGSSTRRPCAAGCYKSGYRHRRSKNPLDNLSHRRIQAPWGIDLQYDEGCAFGCGVMQAAFDKVGASGRDHTVDFQHQYGRSQDEPGQQQ